MRIELLPINIVCGQNGESVVITAGNTCDIEMWLKNVKPSVEYIHEICNVKG